MNVVRALPRPERPTLDHAQRARLTSELQELSGAAVTTSGDDRWPTAFGAERLLFGSQFLCLPGLLPGRHVTVRLEGINGVGSIKGRAAYAMVRSLEITGMLRPGGHVVESSSGNLGVALAALCCQRGYRFTCVTDPNTSSHVTDLIEAYGSTVVQVHERDENGGYLATRLRTVQTVLAGDPLAVWPNQYGNEANLLAHEATTAPEIAAGVPHLSVLAVGAGTTGTLGGCTRWFRRHRPDVAVIAIDSVGSVTFGGPPSPRRIPGLGTSSRPPIADNATPHHIHHVAEIDGVRMCHHIRDRFGVMVGGSTGSVLAGVHQLGRLWALGTTGQSALVEWLFTRNRRRSPGIGRVAATVAPTLAVVGATLVTVHLLAGTQRLAATIAPSMIMGFVFISIYALGLDRRSQHHVGSP